MGSLWGKKAEPTEESADKLKKNFEGTISVKYLMTSIYFLFWIFHFLSLFFGLFDIVSLC